MYAMQSNVSTAPNTPTERNVLLLKGLTWGIPDRAMSGALDHAVRAVRDHGITTVVWDGDKLPYFNEQGERASSFVRLVVLLVEAFPHLELIYFKKQGCAKSLLANAEVSVDRYGQMLGPFSFLLPATVTILPQDAKLTDSKTRHTAVEFPTHLKWDELGLAGLAWLKTNGIDQVQALIVGQGRGITKELAAVQAKPDAYPKGYIEATVVNVERK